MSKLTNTGAAHEPSGVETNPHSVLNETSIASGSSSTSGQMIVGRSAPCRVRAPDGAALRGMAFGGDGLLGLVRGLAQHPPPHYQPAAFVDDPALPHRRSAKATSAPGCPPGPTT